MRNATVTYPSTVQSWTCCFTEESLKLRTYWRWSTRRRSGCWRRTWPETGSVQRCRVFRWIRQIPSDQPGHPSLATKTERTSLQSGHRIVISISVPQRNCRSRSAETNVERVRRRGEEAKRQRLSAHFFRFPADQPVCGRYWTDRLRGARCSAWWTQKRMRVQGEERVHEELSLDWTRRLKLEEIESGVLRPAAYCTPFAGHFIVGRWPGAPAEFWFDR